MQKRALRAMRAPQIPQSRSRFRSSIVICAPQWGQTLAAPGKGAPHEEQCSVTASRLGFMSMADRSYTLTIMRRSGLLALLVLLAIPGGCVFAQAAVAPAEAKPVAAPARPSVLIVTLDTTRADALGCYGAPEWATPNLDALARRGVRFATARAPAPITAPAHATIFTGLYPFQHGVRDNGTFVLRDDVQTLAERLKAADYATAAVPAAIVVDSTFGLNQGFDHYFDPEQNDMQVGDETESRNADEVVDVAMKHLATLAPDARFFLWVHFFDAHYPYTPPQDLIAAHPFEPPTKGRGQLVAQQKHLYQLEVARVDRALGRLLKALDRFGGAQNVLTIVVGDHGEGLGQHGEATHAALVYDATLRVPFLIAHPSLPQGRVVEPAVSTIDVTPTLLALLGLPADGTSGADLAPLWRGEKLAHERLLYFENCATWFTSGWAPLYGCIDGRFKTILGPQIRVFDVEADREEKQDLVEQQEDVVERAKEQLAALADETFHPSRHEPTAAELERLRQLGYPATGESARRDGFVPPGWQPKRALSPEQGLENTRRFTQANVLWRQGKRDDALATLLALVNDEPENAHYAEIAAALLAESGRAAEGLPLARRATELAENFGNRSTLVACLLALGKTEEALTEVTITVERFPRLMPARFTIAKLLIDRGRKADAVPHLELFLREWSGDAPTRAQAQALLDQARKG
jgi:arylsulfatase A-like enzyme